MGVIGIIVAIAIGLFLAALAYGINIFDVFLLEPVQFTLVVITIAAIVLIAAARWRL
jgi:hypothetical protein